MKTIRPVIKQIPNTITSLNLLSGCISIVLAFNGRIYPAALLIFLAGIFDFLDGFAARLLKAYSEFGKSLDSLADMVSFGIAPSAILFQLLILAVQKKDPNFQFISGNMTEVTIVLSAFLIAVFSALRLAKFNTDPRQTSSFIGIPTPANAFLIASLPFVMKDIAWIINLYILIPMILVLSILLISELPMISLKFKNVSFHDNKAKYTLIGLSALLLGFFRISAIPLIFLLYVALSLTTHEQFHSKPQ